MSDLFGTYTSQGLPLTGQGCGDKRTPIDYAVCNFNELSGKHGRNTVYNLIRLLHKLGADENQYRVYKAREAQAIAEHKAKAAKLREQTAKYQGCVVINTFHTVGLKTDGTVVAVGKNTDGQCNVSGWRDIGPSKYLCKYCDGRLGGLFTKKCKVCGKEQ